MAPEKFKFAMKRGKSARKCATISADFEPTMNRLLRQACEGGDEFVAQGGGWPTGEPDKIWIRDYIRHVHKGFAVAQEEVYARLKEAETKSSAIDSAEVAGEEIFLRSVIDVIAWQMIGRELYVARRLYRGQKPPSLTHSNADSVMDVAREMAAPAFDSFGLLADLTTFVQLGDILATGRRTARLEVIEVKEGRKNEKILDFSKFIAEARCERALELFREVEGEKSLKQLQRIQRQAQRMGAVSSLLNREEGMDPDLGVQVFIREPAIQPELYDNRLSQIIQGSHEHGWALDVIDDCVFVAAYRGTMRATAESAFGMWFDMSGADPQSPRFDLLASLTHPLALPLFGRFISREMALDLLFGRCRVMIGIHIPAFVQLISKSGGKVRQATRKEAARFDRPGSKPIMLDKKPLVVELPGGISVIHDGILVRMLFHGMTPQSAANVLLEPARLGEGNAASERDNAR